MALHRAWTPLLALVLGGLAGAAQAQPADRLREAVFRASPRTPAVGPSGYAPAARGTPGRPLGVARTAIDHRFDRDGLEGSLGFLCGLQPKADTAGAAAAYGVDPQGRFLGVKLHLSLR